MHRFRAIFVAGTIAAAACFAATTAAVADAPASPSLGSNVVIFDPSMSQSQVQAMFDSVSSVQVNNQFGTQRFALLFKPGTYGSADNPLVLQMGYYMSLAGLGQSPNDVVINGAIVSFNQCFGLCTGLDNFWRSVSNLTLNVHLPKTHPAYAPAPPEDPGCANSNDLYAISQAAPIRRVHVNGLFFLFDYCNTGFTSGGFIADSQFTGSAVVNGSQQQFLTRNTQIDAWSNGVWNQVFSGDVGAPPQCFPAVPKGCGPYTTLPSSPVTREAPYLYLDSAGNYNVFVPSAQVNSVGTTWASGQTPGVSMSIDQFFVAHPSDSAATINAAIHRGKNLLLTPGIYKVDQPIDVTRPDSVVLGLGFPTLVPTSGNAAITVASAEGMLISGVLFDAGPVSSPVLLQVGDGHARSDNEASDPSVLSDVFFRVGGAAAGKVTTALVVNSKNVILDDIWSWRADHGNGVGWTSNTADTGVIVNGDNVTAYGLFVEHYQKFNVIWNGNGGTDIFFQNEMPYDVPSQASWMEAPGVDGYAAFKVGDSVTSFHGYGMGSYSFFNKGIDIFAANGFEVPASLPAGSLHDIFTLFLDKVHGKGGISNVINNIGGSSTIANPDIPVTVVSYP